jgi:hypothetical protein
VPASGWIHDEPSGHARTGPHTTAPVVASCPCRGGYARRVAQPLSRRSPPDYARWPRAHAGVDPRRPPSRIGLPWCGGMGRSGEEETVCRAWELGGSCEEQIALGVGRRAELTRMDKIFGPESMDQCRFGNSTDSK